MGLELVFLKALNVLESFKTKALDDYDKIFYKLKQEVYDFKFRANYKSG
uniref:Uncharacterized protein n=1 Tax=Romanomermis culicivorax TaxID=13658 RepID=A0A915JCE2_ROMCU